MLPFWIRETKRYFRLNKKTLTLSLLEKRRSSTTKFCHRQPWQISHRIATAKQWPNLTTGLATASSLHCNWQYIFFLKENTMIATTSGGNDHFFKINLDTVSGGKV